MHSKHNGQGMLSSDLTFMDSRNVTLGGGQVMLCNPAIIGGMVSDSPLLSTSAEAVEVIHGVTVMPPVLFQGFSWASMQKWRKKAWGSYNVICGIFIHGHVLSHSYPQLQKS